MRPNLSPAIAMICGFATLYPMNALLLHLGCKEAMEKFSMAIEMSCVPSSKRAP